MKYAALGVSLVIWLWNPTPVLGQEASEKDTIYVDPAHPEAPRRVGTVGGDTLREYDLSEITVLSGQQSASTSSGMQKIGLAAISRQDARSAAEIARLIPAAHVHTNSRGETIAYLRNAGERQVAFFLDGLITTRPLP